jgi:hypothetical protein
MGKSALFLVQTPLHVINALEAIKKFGIVESTFFIVTSDHNKKWRLMMERMLPTNAKRTYCIRDDFDVEKGTNAYAQHIPFLKDQNFELLFFADARLYIFVDIVNSLRVDSTFLMDDGTGTLLAVHSLMENGVYYDMSVSSSLTRQKEIEKVKKKYKLWELKPVKYNLFTVFDYPNCDYFNVVRNEMTRLCYSHEGTDKDKVLFIGQPFVKIRHMKAKDYLACLLKVKSFYGEKEIKYLPHPREDSDFLNNLASLDGFSVIDTIETAENYIISTNNVPHSICGFLSTSLWNIAKFQKGVEVASFKIPETLFNPELKVKKTRSSYVTDLAFLNIIYQYYEKKMRVHPL